MLATPSQAEGHLRLVSINLNKRAGNDAGAARVADWLRSNGVDVVCAQEPWPPLQHARPRISGYTLAAGGGDLAVWTRDGIDRIRATEPAPWMQRLELGWLVAFQVHLDPASREGRAKQLQELRDLAGLDAGRPLLVCGDFNIAPRQIDGVFGDAYSRWNSTVDRDPLAELMSSLRLVDVCAVDPPSFTFERQQRGQRSAFRCDLGLLSDHLARSGPMPSASVRTEDGVRAGPLAFTDHSAVVMDLPVTLQRPDAAQCRPEHTAIARGGPSRAARLVAKSLLPKGGTARVLDHGCGHGADVDFYRLQGVEADGYDPGFADLWPEPRRYDYDLVTSVFVLNVLPDPWGRITALRHASQYLRPGGLVLAVTRSPGEIALEARLGAWTAHNDGYWSMRRRGMFQRGIDTGEIVMLARHAGLDPAFDDLPVPSWRDACAAWLVKRR